MKHRSLIASKLGIGLGIYLLVLIATAPATLADAVLQSASQGKLRLVEAQGSLWSGAGQIEMRDASGRTGVARSIAWRIVPGSLLRGHLTYQVGLEQASKRFPVTLSLSRIELANADISLPATVLGLGVPKFAPLGLTGEVQIQVANLSIARNGMEGSATLRWRAAGSALTSISPLGDYQVQFKAVDSTLHAVLSTLEGTGPLQLEGTGAWSNSAPPSFLATARVAPQYQQQLAPLLRLIAVERGAGRFELQFK